MRYDRYMRTTLELDEDVVEAARRFARQHGVTLGEAVTALVRKAITREAPPMRNGFHLLASRRTTKRPSLELVNQLRDG